MTLSMTLLIQHRPNKKEMSTSNYRPKSITSINKMQLVDRCGHQKPKHRCLKQIIMLQMIWMILMNWRRWVINLCLNRTTTILRYRTSKDILRRMRLKLISKDDRWNSKKKCNSKKPSSRELRCSQVKLISSKSLKLAQLMKVPTKNNSNYKNRHQIWRMNQNQ